MAVPVIAVVNQDPTFLTMMHETLTTAGYEAAEVLADADAFARLRTLRPSLIILDIPAYDRAYAWQLIARIDEDHTGAPLIVCSGDTFFLRKEAEHLVRYGYSVVEKPFTRAELLQRIAEEIARAACLPCITQMPDAAGAALAAR